MRAGPCGVRGTPQGAEGAFEGQGSEGPSACSSRSQLVLLRPLPRREPAQLSSEGSVGLTPGTRSRVSPRWCRGGWLGEAGLPQLGICSSAPDAPAARWQGVPKDRRCPCSPTRAAPHPQAPGTHVLSAGPSSSPAHAWPSPCPASPTPTPFHALPTAQSSAQIPISSAAGPHPAHTTHHVPGAFHAASKRRLWNCVLGVCLSWRAACGALGTAAPRTPRQLQPKGTRCADDEGERADQPQSGESLAQAAGRKDPTAAV